MTSCHPTSKKSHSSLLFLIALVVLIKYLIKPRPCPPDPPCPPPPPPPAPVCFPVEPTPRPVPIVSTNVIRVPQDQPTIDAALAVLGAGAGVIALNGILYSPANPAVSPSTLITTNVRFTSQNPLFPAVVANTFTPNNFAFSVTSATPLTVVFENLQIWNTNLVFTTGRCVTIDGEHDVYFENVTFKTNARAISSFNTFTPPRGSQLQVQNCFFDGVLEYIPTNFDAFYILIFNGRDNMIFNNNMIVGRKRQLTNESPDIFIQANGQVEGANFSFTNNMTIDTYPLRRFVFCLGNVSVALNNRLYVYNNLIHCGTFILFQDSIWIDAFELVATRDNIVVNAPIFSDQSPFILLLQSPTDTVVGNSCVFYSRNNDYAQTSLWTPTGLRPVSTPTSAWNVQTGFADNDLFFASYSEPQFLDYPLFPFADQVPCDSPLVRDALAERARIERQIKRNKARENKQAIVTQKTQAKQANRISHKFVSPHTILAN